MFLQFSFIVVKDVNVIIWNILPYNSKKRKRKFTFNGKIRSSVTLSPTVCISAQITRSAAIRTSAQKGTERFGQNFIYFNYTRVTLRLQQP